MTPTQLFVQQNFPNLQVKFDFELAPMTYMKIGGPAEVYIELNTREDIIDVVKACAQQNIKVTVLGGASNIIVPTQGLSGVVITLNNQSYQVLPQKLEDGRQLVQVGAGFRTALFVRKTIDDGFRGLEYFLGVPGKLGGAIYNNAHYLSDLVGEHIYRVEVVHPDGSTDWFSQADAHFGYDYSIFHERQDIILQAEFALHPGDKEESMKLIREATEYRARTQPLGEPSSGCYFRNTPNTDSLKQLYPQYQDRKEFPAAFLIDQAGLKGKKVGGVSVSHKHAAFFVNDGTGTSDNVKELANLVKESVNAKYGVQLQEEVFFLK
jgi:UDP-N-acetylenolpyruvoylglucosamine reductase